MRRSSRQLALDIIDSMGDARGTDTGAAGGGGKPGMPGDRRTRRDVFDSHGFAGVCSRIQNSPEYSALMYAVVFFDASLPWFGDSVTIRYVTYSVDIMFCLEFLLKVAAFGLIGSATSFVRSHEDGVKIVRLVEPYLNSRWNRLDFLVLFSSLGNLFEALELQAVKEPRKRALSTAKEPVAWECLACACACRKSKWHAHGLQAVGPTVMKGLVILRSLRPIRLVSRSEDLRELVTQLIRSTRPVVNVFFFMLIVYTIFAVVGDYLSLFWA